MINYTKSSVLIFGLSILILNLASCKKDDDPVIEPPLNEDELITSLIVQFTDSAGVEPVKTAVFSDPDGEGGDAPKIYDTIRLTNNSTYFTEILLLNESVSPADTISHEVLEEADEHIFCFEANNVHLNIIRTDSDGTYELGLQSKWRTGNVSSGEVSISLKHQPGVKDGSCLPGDTDVEVKFITEIK